MLLVIDVGNTHVVIGLYRDSELAGSWRLQSDRNRTVDEYALEVLSLLGTRNAEIRARRGIQASDITNVVICSVVPPLTRVFTKLSQKYFSHTPLIVGPGIRTDLALEVDDPKTLGADRIVNAVAAKKLYGTPAIVIDFGTATTFDVLNRAGVYEGGIIAPGVVISAEALSERAALLPRIELREPNVLIGKNTHDAMLSGIYFGYLSLVSGIIERLRSKLGKDVIVVATGGLASVFAEDLGFVTHVVPDLTLRGLQIIAELNANDA